MYVLSYKEFIDDDRYNTCLSVLTKKGRRVVERIVKETIYVTEVELVYALRRCIDKLHDTVDKYYLYVPSNRISSIHYILRLVGKYLHPVDVLFGHTEDTVLEHDYPIVVIDDAIYSSCSMCDIVDNFQYDTDYKYMNRFYCLVAFVSQECTQVTTEFGAVVIADKNLESVQLKSLMDDLDVDFDYMYDHFDCESVCVLPLIFEHAIGNAFSSYQFYHTILKKPINREPIESLRWNDVKEIINHIRCVE